MANKASKVVNGTAAEEPSDHRTRFNRKKIPNINLESKKKVITFDKGDSYGTDCDEDHNKDNDKDDKNDHWNDNDDDDKNDDNDNSFFLEAFLL